MTKLFVKKLSETAVLPKRGSELAAGWDLAASQSVVVPANGKAIVPTAKVGWTVPYDAYAPTFYEHEGLHKLAAAAKANAKPSATPAARPARRRRPRPSTSSFRPVCSSGFGEGSCRPYTRSAVGP